MVDLDIPMPGDADSPPEMIGGDRDEPLTAERLDALLHDDKAAAMRPGVFARLIAMRKDRAEWLLIGETFRRHKLKRTFDMAVKEYDLACNKKKITREEQWAESLIWKESKDGTQFLDKCLSNVITILQHDPEWRGSIALDRFSNRIVMRGRTPFERNEDERWSDTDVVEVLAWIERKYDIRPALDVVHNAIVVVARRQSFNPLKDYVESLPDTPCAEGCLIETWLTDFFGAPDTPLTRAIGVKWLVSAIARAYEPGVKVDTVLILEGKQGLKKSRVLSQLVPEREWFSDGLSAFGSKDQAIEIEGKWIIELAEMKGFGRDINEIKAFITREAENYRPPYGRNNIHSPRKCIFAATVNPEDAGYLRDSTGNRRYWPIECTKQAPDMTPEIRDQLWAEAKHKYLAGEIWWFDDPEMIAAAEEEQNKRVVGDIWQDLVEYYLIDKTDTSTAEIARDCLKVETGRQDHGLVTRIGKIMKLAKWERWRPSKRPGERQGGYRYRRIDSQPGSQPPLPFDRAQAA